MYKATRVLERRATPKKVAAYLAVIALLGAFGVFLVGAVVNSHFFEALNKMSLREILTWRTLAAAGGVSILGLIGVAFSYVANKFADELWDMVRNKKGVTL